MFKFLEEHEIRQFLEDHFLFKHGKTESPYDGIRIRFKYPVEGWVALDNSEVFTYVQGGIGMTGKEAVSYSLSRYDLCFFDEDGAPVLRLPADGIVSIEHRWF